MPINVTLLFEGGGQLSINSGVTVTIDEPSQIIASPTQTLFTGNGSVVFLSPGTVHVAWWWSDRSGSTAADPKLQAAIDSLPASIGGRVELLPGLYNITQTLILRSMRSFYFGCPRIFSHKESTGGACVFEWNGAANGTVVLIDGCADGILEGFEIISGTANFGVGIDWDKVSGTEVSTHVQFRQIAMRLPSAGIGFRLAKVADANHEDGLFEECYIDGPSTSPGSRGTCIAYQVNSVQAFTNKIRGGGIKGVSVGIDLQGGLSGKSAPPGGFHLEYVDAGYCDTFIRFYQGRHPLVILGCSIEFADRLLIVTSGSSGNEFQVSFIGCRIPSNPSTMTNPFIDYRVRGTLTLLGTSFTENMNNNSAWKIRFGTGGPEAGRLVAIGCSFPNSTPWDTTQIFHLTSLGNTYLDVSNNFTALLDEIGGYGARDYVPLKLTNSLVCNVQTFGTGDATPSVKGGNVFKTNNTSATTVTMFDDGVAGQEITVIFTDGNTTLSDAGNLKLAGGFTSTGDDTMRLVFDGTNWYEVSRSVN